MKGKNKEMDLLDLLCQQVGYENLSDLRYPAGRDRLKMADLVEQLKEIGYSLQEWSDAVKYITGISLPFTSPDEAADFLEECLRRESC